jgi:MFS family permease
VTMTQAPPRRLVACLVFAAVSGSVVAGLGNPILVEVADRLSVSLEAAQWTLTMTLLVGGLVTPIVSRVADGRHRKSALIGALATIAVGSLIGAAVPTYAGLLVARALHGLGYSLVALTVGIAREHLAGARLQRTMATLSTSLAAGVGLANPMVGLGVLVWDYRAGFLLAFVVSAAGALWVRHTVPAPRSDVDPVGQDRVGALLLSLALGALLLAVSRGNVWGWRSAAVLGLGAAGAALLVVWVVVERRAALPMVDVRLAVRRGVLGANLGALLIGWAVFGCAAVAVVLVQSPASGGVGGEQVVGLGRSVFVTGLLMVPMAFGSLVSPPIARRLEARFGERVVFPVGSFACAVGFAALARWHTSEVHVAVMMALMGLGVGIAYAVLPGLIVARTPRHRTTSATGLNQVLRLVGGSLGAAVAAAVLSAHLDPVTRRPVESGYVAAALISLVVALCATAAVWVLVPPTPSAPSTQSSALPYEP